MTNECRIIPIQRNDTESPGIVFIRGKSFLTRKSVEIEFLDKKVEIYADTLLKAIDVATSKISNANFIRGFTPEEKEQFEKENTPKKFISKSAERGHPKKPIYLQANMNTQYIICPNCHKYKGMDFKIPYCLLCGQALDWSKDN